MGALNITPILLAGGAGSRLWPVSRDDLPKQFQPLVGDLSTYQQTLKRVSNPQVYGDPIVITSDQFRFFAKRQAVEVDSAVTVVLEPMRRDSAAAMAVAALMAERRSPGGMVLALAADHVVLDDDLFTDAVRLGAEAAEAGNIVVFGLVPTEPRTAYGYIRPGELINGHEDLRLVEAFVEKPNAATAIEYMKAGYLWNSGNFLFRADVMIAEFERYAPEILAAARASIESGFDDIGFFRLDAASFARSPQTSIDYAVIEKTRKIAVTYGRFRWSDIGAWDAIWEVNAQDDRGNAIHGNGLALASDNCLVYSDGPLTTVVGASDLIVVSTRDAVMVVPKSRAQDVKKLVEHLKAGQIGEASAHRLNHRPWGWVDSVDKAERFAVKRIFVEPQGQLSLHRHLHRAEHWVVVNGTATVQIGNDVRLVTENESIYVPLGSTHRITNEGRIPLELIEIQTGSYLSEDDIVRFDDIYHRK